MIKLAAERPTDYRSLERVVSSLPSPSAVRAFYDEIIERYTGLDATYCFSESFDPDDVFAQIEQRWTMRDRELFGMPFGIKDVFNTAVLPTAMGSDIWRGFRAGNNARVVDEIADRGGIIFSKTTTAEFAVHYIQDGKTINPHNPGHITGTSSAGSAVAVACGALPVCLGTQTGASIVRPASFCGVFGFKPSFGAFDRTGTLKTTDTLDTIGLLGSDIYGLRKVFLAAFQKDPQYPFARNYFARLAIFQKQTAARVGLVTRQFLGYGEYDSFVREDFAAACELLEDDTVTMADIPDIEFINEIHRLHEHIYCKSLSYYFQAEFSAGGDMSEIMTRMISAGAAIPVDVYVDALRQQPLLRARFDAAFQNFDFILTPSTASPAPAIGEQERNDTGLIWTFLGYPVLSIPAFWSERLGLPFGLQIVAPKFGDLALLDFGDQVVQRLSGRRSADAVPAGR